MLNSQNELRWCAESLAASMRGKERRRAYLELLRRMGEAIQESSTAVDALLASFAPEERFLLLHYCAMPLRVELATRIARQPNSTVRRTTQVVSIPDGLPQSLVDGLQRFEKRLQTRFRTLLERGHSRSPAYVAKEMGVPIRLAVFLAKSGVERWDVVRMRDLVAFFRENPGTRRSAAQRFLQSLEDHRPFRDRRGRPVSGGRRMRDSRRHPVPAVLRPAELKQFLRGVRERYSDPEYLLAWMVCQLGMIAKNAHEISLDRIRQNDKGELVIRPALVWIELPSRIGNMLRSLVEEVEPNWADADPDSLCHVTVFDKYIPNLDRFLSTVLQRRSRMLRASAIFAAMLDGYLDRVTLRQSMGVSMPTITKLERLLSVDIHRKLDPDFVEARNALIRGEPDD